MTVSFCLPHPVAVRAFMICSGLCVCTKMLWMCVLYVSNSKVNPEPLGALPWVVHCCVFLGPDCSYILQGMALFCLDLV